jgi:putative membrane protein
MAEIDADSYSPKGITRPSGKLLAYYFFSSLLLGPLFFLALIPLLFRYKTMRFAFDDQGITLKYGAFFQTEKRLNYRRIQDIHLTRGIIQRRFGLANVSLFTASGSAGPEMTLEGFSDPDALRDYLNVWGRKAREGVSAAPTTSSGTDDEVLNLLREIRDSLHNATRDS